MAKRQIFLALTTVLAVGLLLLGWIGKNREAQRVAAEQKTASLDAAYEAAASGEAPPATEAATIPASSWWALVLGSLGIPLLGAAASNRRAAVLGGIGLVATGAIVFLWLSGGAYLALPVAAAAVCVPAWASVSTSSAPPSA